MVELSAFRLAVHGGVSAAGGKIFELEVPISRFYQGDQQDHRISPLRGVLAKHRGAVRWIAVMLAWAQECTRKQHYVYMFFFFCFFSNVYLTAHVNAPCTHTRTPGNVRVHINGGGNAPPPPSPPPHDLSTHTLVRVSMSEFGRYHPTGPRLCGRCRGGDNAPH